jgi:diguanylate cyclase (GGDEF)-like protein
VAKNGNNMVGDCAGAGRCYAFTQMPSNFSELLLGLIALQQLLAGGLWLVAGAIKFAPSVPARHWSAASFWAAATALMALYGGAWGGDWYSHDVVSMLAPGIYLLLRLGLEILFRAPRHDGEHLAVIVLALACAAAGATGHMPASWPVVYSSALSAFCLLRCAHCVHDAAKAELGWRAMVVLAPWYAAGVMLLARLLLALLWPEQVALPLAKDTLGNAIVLALFMTLAMVCHVTIAAAVALRLVTRLERLSRIDPLTGLSNRRGMSDSWPRGPYPLCVVAVDVDHFKRINDTHGHAAGDAALQYLARLMLRSARGGDLVARIGGEEFLIILPGSDVSEAQHAAERLRQVIEQGAMRWGELSLRFTVSAGVAEWRDGDTPDSLVARADAALYAAKRGGRNRVVISDPANEAHA